MSIQDFPKVPTPSVNDPNAQIIQALYNAVLGTIQVECDFFKKINSYPSIQKQICSHIQALDKISNSLQQAYLDYQSSSTKSRGDSLRNELPDLFK